jgi:hypothetical protein
MKGLALLEYSSAGYLGELEHVGWTDANREDSKDVWVYQFSNIERWLY